MAGGYSVVISASDRVTATIDRINARMAKFGGDLQKRIDTAAAPFQRLGASIAKFGEVSGINRVVAATRGLARAGQDAFQKIGQVVPLIGVLGGAASVAGITRMVTAWTEWGSRVGFTAQRIGIAASTLSGFQGAARLAGSSAEGASSGLQALGQTMYDAIGGRAPEAIVMFRTLGIEFQNASGHARSVTEILPEVADKIKAIRDPFAQAQVAASLFGGAAEDLLPFLRRGSEGIRDYVAMAQRYGVISDSSAAAANRLREAQAKVSLAVEGLRNRIAERLEPVLTPLLTRFAEWVATSPAVAHGIEWIGQKVDQLAHWIDGGGLQAFGATMQHWGDVALGIMDALGGPKLAIEGLIALMVGSFALKVIGPFWTLGSAIVAATVKATALTGVLAKVGSGGTGAGLMGRLGGLLGSVGMLGLAYEATDLAGNATQPSGDGIHNLLHNMLFEANPLHWTQSYHPEGQGGAAPGTAPRAGVVPGAPGGGGPANRDQWSADMAQLQAKGWTREQSAGILGNLDQESGGNSRAVGDGGQAYGLAQHHANRQADFASHYGHTMQQGTRQEQIDFIDWELRNTEKAAGDKLRNAVSARQAAAVVRQYYERPADASGQEDRWRGDRAERMMALPQATGPAVAAPSAQGAPLQLGAAGANDNQGGAANPPIRLHITGDQGIRANVVSNPNKVEVSGPLVERPALLGAQP